MRRWCSLFFGEFGRNVHIIASFMTCAFIYTHTHTHIQSCLCLKLEQLKGSCGNEQDLHILRFLRTLRVFLLAGPAQHLSG